MAKKSKTSTTSTAKKSGKPSAVAIAKKSPPKKSRSKKHDHDHGHHGVQEEEIELDGTEREAIDHIIECEKARDALEEEVNTVVTQAVRKICKAHGKPLTIAQAQNVAMVLFGD